MIDDHAHPVPSEYQPLEVGGLTLDISTDAGAENSRRDAGDKRIFTQLLLGRLSRFLQCPPTEVLEARNERAQGDWARYVAALFSDAQIEGVLMDAGGIGAAGGQAELTGVPVWEMSRIETRLDLLIEQGLGAEEIVSDIESYCEAQRRSGAVAFKSVIAYRTGLGIDPSATIADAQASLEGNGPVRSRGKGLRDLVMKRVLGFCAETGTPLQIHTGYGDSEIYLARSHPLQLEPILATTVGKAASVVLIHGAFPYVRELAYLASVHRNLYAELSLFPIFSPLSVVDVLTQALDGAPYSKIILGTDGHGQPETHYFAAKVLDDAVSKVEYRLASEGVSSAWINEMTTAIRSENARKLYGLSTST